MSSLERCLFRSFAHSFIYLFKIEIPELFVCFGDSLLISYSFCKYFLPSEGCLFILFMVSFAVQNILNLLRSHLFIFVFIFITLGGGSKKTLL